MTSCEKCGRLIVLCNAKDKSGVIRWNYWNKLKEVLAKIDQEGNEELKIALSKEIDDLIAKEYTKPLGFIKDRQLELKDVTIKDAPEQVMDFLKDALNNYVLGKYKAAMILARAAAEHLLLDVISRTDLSNGRKEKLTRDQQGQDNRLSICFYAGIIDEGDFSNFEKIRKSRNDCVHAKTDSVKKPEIDLNADAKESMISLINLVNKTYNK